MLGMGRTRSVSTHPRSGQSRSTSGASVDSGFEQRATLLYARLEKRV